MSRSVSRVSAILTALVAGLATIMLTPGPAQAATAAFLTESAWATGYVGRMTVTNDGADRMAAWRVEFDLPDGTTLDHSWNAVVTRIGTHYVITGASWNASLDPGGSTSFGWIASGTGVPQSCLLNGGSCAGGPTVRDARPPSTPANFRSETQGSTFTLRWDASTDDTGVVGYEISTGTGSGPIATVTTTSHSMSIPPPMAMTFGVRAIDAAGNRSPFATLGLGTPPDVTPPGPATNLRLVSPSGGYFTAQWDAPRDDQFVAGYEIAVDGAVVSRVGGTTAPVRLGFGTYFVSVRAFDGAGNLSPSTQIMISIDPGPSSSASSKAAPHAGPTSSVNTASR
ncbi:cellulose binding domain-containing protein [Paractinoplanes ferrugineus]|uniref:cellulose binding domain-containing protein n=1 Tax=Paractinoplanes ferrugineus TaxID=113564 RepID=UPI0019455F9C|nr:cellulose binding domain-containing protein [Actinoplanes ferrugineus]